MATSERIRKVQNENHTCDHTHAWHHAEFVSHLCNEERLARANFLDKLDVYTNINGNGLMELVWDEVEAARKHYLRCKQAADLIRYYYIPRYASDSDYLEDSTSLETANTVPTTGTCRAK